MPHSRRILGHLAEAEAGRTGAFLPLFRALCRADARPPPGCTPEFRGSARGFADRLQIDY
jgi:hypothetical protein